MSNEDWLLGAVNDAMSANDVALVWQQKAVGTGWFLHRAKLNGNTIPPVYVTDRLAIAEIWLDWGTKEWHWRVVADLDETETAVSGVATSANDAMLHALLAGKFLQEVK